MEVKIYTSKAEVAKQLKVSPAYITMISQGKRTASRKLQRKINRLGLTNSLKNLNGVQVAHRIFSPTAQSGHNYLLAIKAGKKLSVPGKRLLSIPRVAPVLAC